ncbi:MAG: hypothetical protein MOGMAGMI_01736 [Candidatus Omnitrophica bacterium]|nr:hypothetical protein [Candidatus Omnitrophota bacterium]
MTADMTTETGARGIFEMTWEELIAAVRQLPFEEKRQDAEDYFEAVAVASSVAELGRTLEGFFGPPFKPAGQKSSRDADRYSDRYGGVMQNQVLYYKEREGLSNCAMLWPWSDGQRVTVKIGRGVLVR